MKTPLAIKARRRVSDLSRYIPIIAAIGALGVGSGFAGGELPGSGAAECPTCPPPVEQQCCDRSQQVELTIMPYLWAAGLKGTITAKGVPANVDVSFSDIFRNLDYAVIANAELRWNRFFLMSDTVFMKLTADATIDKEVIGPRGHIKVGGDLDATMEEKMWIQELMLGYRLYERDLSCGENPRKFAIDLLGGTRYYMFDTSLNADAKITLIKPGGNKQRKASLNVSDTFDWFDAVVGARMKYDLTDRVNLMLRGDVGGFQGSQDSSWSWTALANFKMTEHWSLIGGYKVLDVQKKIGSSGGVDARMAGPIAAVQYSINF